MRKTGPATEIPADCLPHLKAIHDTQYILAGKWKVVIIGSLAFSKKRYTELLGVIDGIGSKMLSKELGELELNGLVRRTADTATPNVVAYELTAYGHTLEPVIEAMAAWGKAHRHRIMRGHEHDSKA